MFLIIASFVYWATNLYFGFTKPIPKHGGEYVEGIIGQPLYINPLLSQTSEADSDLSQLIYAGLFKFDSEGKLEKNLAESWEISEDQKTYTIKIREGLTWHDGKKMDANDVFFTISILQDPAYKSPLRQNWQGVGVSQIDDYTLKFNISNPYFGFLENLTLGILPKHIWGNIAPEKFSLAEYNLKPIGSGPYQFKDFQKSSSGEILSYELNSFEEYFEGEPYISRIIFNFYPDEETMIVAYNKKEIKGMHNIDSEKIDSIKNKKSTQIKELSFPRYFSVFFNQNKSVALANDDVRKALSQAVDRKKIISQVLKGKGEEIFSPFITSMEEFNSEIDRRDHDIEKSKKILEEADWKMEDGVRKKKDVKLEFKLYTADWPDLVETAQILADGWKEIGANVEVVVLTATDLQQNHIRPREYEALLFGQISSFNPDLYPFWHSSQKQDPGFNLGMFDNKESDDLLRDIRQESNREKRIEKYKELQKKISEKSPVAFVYTPYYLYPVSSILKGAEVKKINSSSWRFSDVSKWYIKTSRVKNN